MTARINAGIGAEVDARPGDVSSESAVVIIVVLCGKTDERLLVEHPKAGIIEALTTLSLTAKQLSAAIQERRQAVVSMCEGTPVVTGLIQPLPAGDEELVLSSDTGVVIRCGEASIRLDAAGRVLIRGRDVVSRALRRNQIVGGAVRLN